MKNDKNLSIVIKDNRELLENIFISNEYICVDFETTGLDPENGDIIEVYLKYMKDGIKIEELHGLFYSENWSDTYHIHKIPYKDIALKQKFVENKKFINKFTKYLNRCMDKNDNLVFMAQYAPFEIKWIKEKIFKNNNIDTLKVYDTWRVEKLLNPNLSGSLIEIAKRRNIIPENGINFHRAKMDVDATWEVYKQQIKEIEVLEYEIQGLRKLY